MPSTSSAPDARHDAGATTPADGTSPEAAGTTADTGTAETTRAPEADGTEEHEVGPAPAGAQVTPATVTDEDEGRPAPVAPAPSHPAPRRIVRPVNWVAFIGTGVVLGFILGGIAHALGPAAQVGGMSYGYRTSLLFIAMFGAMLGGLLGALIGVAADSALQRRSRR